MSSHTGPYQKLSRSPTEDTIVDETAPFVDEEAAWKEGYQPEDRRKTTLLSVVSRLQPLRWVFEAGLVAIIVLLLVGRQTEGHQVTGDITGFAPRCKLDDGILEGLGNVELTGVAVPQKILSFELNRDFVPEKLEDFFTEKTRKNWVDLVPSTFSSTLSS